jgi:hypothetical protein
LQTSNRLHNLQVVVRRLAKVVGDRVQSAFNEEEVEQLQEHLCLASTELTTVLEGIRCETLDHEPLAAVSWKRRLAACPTPGPLKTLKL